MERETRVDDLLTMSKTELNRLEIEQVIHEKRLTQTEAAESLRLRGPSKR
jgi:hypothetical protein